MKDTLKTGKYELSAEVIQSNYKKFMSLCKLFKGRTEQLEQMYDGLTEERVLFAPGSSYNYFHNAIVGGYVDHVLRVIDFAKKEYDHFKALGLYTDNFTVEELLFAAMHHDLGKLGYPGQGKEHYVPCKSDWHIKNQGKIYEKNENIPNMPIQDTSLFLLQTYGIPLTFNEYFAIKTHDGLYDDTNKPFLVSWNISGKQRSNISNILHNADMAAARYEFEQWNEHTNSLNLDRLEDSSFSSNVTESKQIVVRSSYKNKKTETDTRWKDLSSSFNETFSSK